MDYYEGPQTTLKDQVLSNRQISIRERLQSEREILEKRVAELTEALEILGRNPDLERLFTLVNR